ncbi:MAG: helix-turn-helix domain-containing protein [Bacteroidota bacterium]|jgi:predicted nucleotidyltransferase
MSTSNPSFGELLRAQRQAKGLTLRELSERLHVDLSLISKWERDQRSPCDQDVRKLAKALKCDARILRIAWLKDIVIATVGSSDDAFAALKAAEIQMADRKLSRSAHRRIHIELQTLLKQFPYVHRAWIFGSVAREEARLGSDVDLMVEYSNDDRVSYFDQYLMAERLSTTMGRTVDVVEVGALESFAEASAMNDRVLVYESGI